MVPDCTERRLPNRTLHRAQRFGALRSVDGLDLSGTLTFDQALKRGWSLGHPHAKTIQVVLGSAAVASWEGHHRHLYYLVTFGGTCNPAYGLQSPLPNGKWCSPGSFGTVIDAHTGRFIVSGS